MLSQQLRMGIEQVPPPNRVKRITDADAGTTVKLGVSDVYVVVTLTGTNAVTIQLPAVAACAGVVYAIEVITDGNGVTVKDESDSTDWTNQVTTGDGKKLVLYSTGRQFTLIHSDL